MPLASRRRTIVIGLVPLLGILGGLVDVRKIAPLREWGGLYRQIDDRIRGLRPAGTEPNEPRWHCLHGWAVTGLCNICFSKGHVPTVEMVRLRDDLDRRLTGEVDVETLRWIWTRLGQAGPHGRRYVEMYDELFQRCWTDPHPQSFSLPSRARPAGL